MCGVTRIMPVNDQRIRKTNLGYIPSDGEHLEGYISRLEQIQHDIRYGGDNQLHIEKFWCHINPRSSYCWVCDLLDLLDYLVGMNKDIIKADKKHTWKAKRDGSDYTFVPYPKVKPSKLLPD